MLPNLFHLGISQVSFRRRQWQPTPVLLPGKSYGWRSLVGCSPWGHWELDTTQWPHFHFSLSCIGEGNGNPLLCSCLENPRGSGARWAAVCGVTQSRTRLKQLSSSSSKLSFCLKAKDLSAFKVGCCTSFPAAVILVYCGHREGNIATYVWFCFPGRCWL